MEKRKKIIVVSFVAFCFFVLSFFILKNYGKFFGKKNVNYVGFEKESIVSVQTGKEKILKTLNADEHPLLVSVIITKKKSSPTSLYYVFDTDNERIDVVYDYPNDDVFVVRRMDIKSIGGGIQENNQEGVFEDTVSGGESNEALDGKNKDFYVRIEDELSLQPSDLEDVFQRNVDYQRYAKKYPEMFNGYKAVLTYDESDDMWKWDVFFYEANSDDQTQIKRGMNLLVDMENESSIISNRINLK